MFPLRDHFQNPIENSIHLEDEHIIFITSFVMFIYTLGITSHSLIDIIITYPPFNFASSNYKNKGCTCSKTTGYEK